MTPEELQTQLNSNYYFNLISFTLLFYDYFLTLEWEVSRYWRTSFTWPNILFFANRYGTLLGNIPVVIQYFWSTAGTPEKITMCGLQSSEKIIQCSHLESYHQYFIIATQVMVAAMLTLRTYALFERDKRALALMIVVILGAIAAGLWCVLTGKAVDRNTNLQLYFGCNYPISPSQGITLAASWGGVALFDCIIFLLTLYKVFSRRRPTGTDLLTVLLRDGAVYFGVLFISNLSNMLTFVLGTPFTRGIATTFTNIISSIMITRLMLNLRDPALSHMTGRLSTTVTTGHGIRFAPSGRGRQGSGAPELDTTATLDIALENRENAKSVGHV
ncbi:hypothetical protein C8R43DRAFT_1110720 [Mycena crocata]|nr:hypothetical protein C8R43DRAFT_1110720 [Mycena crocata]